MKVHRSFRTPMISRKCRLDEPVMIKRPVIVDTIPTNIPTSPKRDGGNLENKLQRLEQLQYALTKQVDIILWKGKENAEICFFVYSGIGESQTCPSSYQ